MIVAHCALLAGLVFAWVAFSTRVSIDNPDVTFGFMAVEFVLIVFVARFSRRGAELK